MQNKTTTKYNRKTSKIVMITRLVFGSISLVLSLLISSALSIAHNLLPHISSSETLRFKFISGLLKYGTILFFIFATLDFTVKYLRNI